MSRKRAFNMMEDLKGKIRVYCRVRPILNFEKVRSAICLCVCLVCACVRHSAPVLSGGGMHTRVFSMWACLQNEWQGTSGGRKEAVM